MVGRTVWGPKVPALKGTKASLSYVQCFLDLISSSINVSIFHITWLDAFWADLILYHFLCPLHSFLTSKPNKHICGWIPPPGLQLAILDPSECIQSHAAGHPFCLWHSTAVDGDYLGQHSQPFWHHGLVSWKTGFGMIQVHYIYYVFYFYYYYTVIYNEIVIPLTIMQNQWEPWACFPATKQSYLGGDWRQWHTKCAAYVHSTP